MAALPNIGFLTLLGKSDNTGRSAVSQHPNIRQNLENVKNLLNLRLVLTCSIIIVGKFSFFLGEFFKNITFFVSSRFSEKYEGNFFYETLS